MNMESINMNMNLGHDSEEEKFEKSVEKTKRSRWKKRVLLGFAAFLFANATLGTTFGKSADEDKKDLKQTDQVDNKKIGDNIEKPTYIITPFEQEGDSDNDSNVEDMDDPSASVDLINYFEVDKADISLENQKQLSDQFEAFLDSIDKDNVDDILNTDFSIYGSSDERSTNAWGEKGNEALTEARLSSITILLYKILQKHDFSKADLSSEDIKDLKKKNFNLKTVTSPHSFESGEMGTTSLLDMMNPETKSNYTQEEINNMSPKELEEAYQDARYINLMLEGYDKTPNERQYELIIKTFAEYGNINLLVDKSPSMSGSKLDLINAFKTFSDKIGGDIVEEKQVNITSFSDKLGTSTDVNSLAEMEKVIRNAEEGNSNEKVISVLLEKIKNIGVKELNNGQENLIAVITDEAIQDLSVENINSLQKIINNVQNGAFNLDIIIYLLDSRSGNVYPLTAQNLIDIFHQQIGNGEEGKLYSVHTNTVEQGNFIIMTAEAKEFVDPVSPNL